MMARSIPSPVGRLRLVADGHALVAVLWPDDRRRFPALAAAVEGDHPLLAEAERQLAAYFAGHLRAFSLPLAPRGTPFQRAVWAALRDIPFGEVRSYGAIAAALGRPTASRAVGAAIGGNPLSILIPCHRVIAASGRLTGFAGGLDAKTRLLMLEGGTGWTPARPPRHAASAMPSIVSPDLLL